MCLINEGIEIQSIGSNKFRIIRGIKGLEFFSAFGILKFGRYAFTGHKLHFGAVY